MKTLLILLLLIPSLSLGSEKKAREIFVNAKKDYATTGCTSADLFRNQKDITKFVTDLVIGISKKNLTVVKGSVMHYQDELDEKIVCYKAYLEELAPAYNQIIDEFPETEVAYNIMNSGEYIASNQVEIINQNLELINSKLKELDEELKDEAKSFKVDKNILDKAIDEIKKEKKKSEPMTVAEIYELTKQIHSCLELNIGAKANFIGVKPVIYLEVNPNRTVRITKFAHPEKLSDPKYRAAAETGMRALNNPECSPLNLPEDKYESWKEINFTFDFSWDFS